MTNCKKDTTDGPREHQFSQSNFKLFPCHFSAILVFHFKLLFYHLGTIRAYNSFGFDFTINCYNQRLHNMGSIGLLAQENDVISNLTFSNTVKPVLSGHSKNDQTKALKTNGSLMKVESIAECSPWSIQQYF